jgi:murein DD-endopeptidase MepM/ murein hydrolase activator NlpD
MMETHGNRQYTISPLAFDWEPYITSYYGWRADPFTGEKSFHTGIDIGVGTGTEVVAGHDGVVSLVTYGTTGYGYQVKIDGEDGLQTRYAHLSEIYVSEGQEVTKGEIIAKTGNTGASTGPHLHYEVIVSGNYLNPLFFAQTTTEE